MPPLQLIEAVRTGGMVRGGVLQQSFARPETAARAFGLRADADIYIEVDAEEAASVLRNVIHEDMAYGYEFTPLEHAEQLAVQFLQAIPASGTRYFTNGTFGRPRESPNIGPSWSPATDATFDTGVLILGSSLSACLWFEDED